MSLEVLNLAWPLLMPSSRKFVLIALADRADDAGRCYPSIDDIRVRTGLGERTIQDALKDLERAGALSREFRRGRATVYVVTPGTFQPPQLSHPRSSRTPADVAGEGCDSCTPTPAAAAPAPAAAAPITINNRQLNHQVNRHRTRTRVEPDGFSEFYAAYPLHVGRLKASQAFSKAGLSSVDLPKLLAAVASQASSPQWTKDGGQFIPYPATWLNQRRWEDESPKINGAHPLDAPTLAAGQWQ